MAILDRINKIQELLREATNELELLKKELGESTSSHFEESSMAVAEHLKEIAAHFEKTSK